jgi:DNA-damage-inducible protein D
VADHFAGVGKLVDLGSGSQREIEDIMLACYACLLTTLVECGESRRQLRKECAQEA